MGSYWASFEPVGSLVGDRMVGDTEVVGLMDLVVGRLEEA